MRKLVILVTVISVGLFLVSCGGPTATPTTPATTPTVVTTPAATTTPPAAIDATALFASNCAVCHGQKREGLPALNAPALTPTTLADDSIAAITGIITDGVPGTAMAGFKSPRLTSAQIDALAQFVKNTTP